MNRAKWLLFLSLISVGGASAQTISSIMIGTSPTGAVFTVDGQLYNQTQTFLWPQGSKHVLNFPYSLDNNGSSLGYQLSSDASVQYTFQGWGSGNLVIGNGALMVTITADPSLTSVIATLTQFYQVQVLFPQAAPDATCSGAPGNPTNGGFQDGIVYINSVCYATSSTAYVTAGSVPLTEYAYPGWVFYGWEIDHQFQLTGSNYNITHPTTFQPLFSIAKRVHFMTSPPGLTVLVDRTVSATPLTPSADQATCTFNGATQIGPNPPPGFPALCTGDYDFLPGSSHNVGATTPQMDAHNNYWIFEGFTNGLGQNGVFVPDAQTQASTTLTASFVPGVKVQLTSSQPGLQFSVDGRTNWPVPYTFVWGQGETHTISAPSPQVDSSGRTWTFVKWSNGGSQTQTLTVPSNTTSLPLTATFVELPQVTINSVPQGIQLSLNGTPCTTPCAVSQANGTSVTVTAPSSISSSAVSRMSFSGWSDGTTTAARTINLNQNTQAYQVNYQQQWAVVATPSPAGSVQFTYSPSTPDGFFNDGTQVTVNAVTANGFKFIKWSGDLSGSYATGYLTMSGPHAITAYAQAVPAIAPAGIMSAAGATPDGTMAPGSVISIYGSNLAPALQIGSTNPLPQSLGNITVTIGNYLLPLLFVSPGQINAQLPVELVDGNYTLLVHQTGQPDVSGTLNVSRDAPGMFTQTNPQNQPLVLALHADGSLVTFDAPAIHGETISIYGTGFGPYVTTTVDGFFVPATPTNSVADAVTLNIGAITKTPDFAGAAPGAVGLTLVQMKITDDLPTGTTVNLSVQVNSKASTTVVLPLQ